MNYNKKLRNKYTYLYQLLFNRYANDTHEYKEYYLKSWKITLKYASDKKNIIYMEFKQ